MTCPVLPRMTGRGKPEQARSKSSDSIAVLSRLVPSCPELSWHDVTSHDKTGPVGASRSNPFHPVQTYNMCTHIYANAWQTHQIVVFLTLESLRSLRNLPISVKPCDLPAYNWLQVDTCVSNSSSSSLAISSSSIAVVHPSPSPSSTAAEAPPPVPMEPGGGSNTAGSTGTGSPGRQAVFRATLLLLCTILTAVSGVMTASSCHLDLDASRVTVVLYIPTAFQIGNYYHVVLLDFDLLLSNFH